jgi:hypothetical protein
MLVSETLSFAPESAMPRKLVVTARAEFRTVKRLPIKRLPLGFPYSADFKHCLKDSFCSMVVKHVPLNINAL